MHVTRVLSPDTIPVTASVFTEFQMDKCLEDELRGAIYCDPDFEQNFLSVPDASKPLLDEALRHCPSNFCAQLPEVSGERALYRPIVNVLNSIKAAVDRVRQDNDLGQIGRDFLDHHASGFYSEDPEMARIKPDLVMLSEKLPKEAEREEVPNARDYVLKMMWRNPDRRPEGEVLRRLSGGYGVVEYLWHSDKLKSSATCHERSATTCNKCHDATPERPEKQRKNLGDLDVRFPEDDKEEEPRYDEIDTSCYTEEPSANQLPCIYSWMLLLSLGRPLWTANNVCELLEAIRDAILGYWHTLNLGILHRDISDGNVLIRVSDHEDKHGSQLVEKQGPRDTRDDLFSLRLSDLATVAPSTTSLSGSNGGEEDHPMAKSRTALCVTLTNLNLSKDSRGFLSDYDLFTTHSKMGPGLFGEPLKPGRTDESHSDSDLECEKSTNGNLQETSQSTTLPKNKPFNKIDYHTRAVGFRTQHRTSALHLSTFVARHTPAKTEVSHPNLSVFNVL
ncbi:hypothetical protein RSOLAG1IB_05405 [Rhizoctonia solani AG-1 IB]|uniref:Fungal-type protein kinase domain-containing protein n=1 Tax=Thanatephorus cucumeris (strain AG1-IB / isolate 7/3/14) TaxID=1108050 RepID=A0A0B7FZG8_THACB|nr:hypothetical protein RSOLAG1IB_05405 [Rhizoctonia solani AG-1 IB]